MLSHIHSDPPKIRSELARHMRTTLAPEIPPDINLNSNSRRFCIPRFFADYTLRFLLSCLYFLCSHLLNHTPLPHSSTTLLIQLSISSQNDPPNNQQHRHPRPLLHKSNPHLPRRNPLPHPLRHLLLRRCLSLLVTHRALAAPRPPALCRETPPRAQR